MIEWQLESDWLEYFSYLGSLGASSNTQDYKKLVAIWSLWCNVLSISITSKQLCMQGWLDGPCNLPLSLPNTLVYYGTLMHWDLHWLKVVEIPPKKSMYIIHDNLYIIYYHLTKIPTTCPATCTLLDFKWLHWDDACSCMHDPGTVFFRASSRLSFSSNLSG